MPLFTQRLMECGYNQAASLSRALDTGKTSSDLLLRIRHTPPQNALPRHARLASVKSAFAVDPLKFDSIKGRSMVLLDDLMTSGAPLAAAAQALRSAGAVHGAGLVFARTENS
jgi:predicted amidophosphoribosyltransferase